MMCVKWTFCICKGYLGKTDAAKAMVVGPDCSFGYKGAGNVELLRSLSKELGFELYVIQKEKDHRRDISSTYIREELSLGNVAKANELLGEPYAIHGIVVHGNHIGGPRLGFPTANIIRRQTNVCPNSGSMYPESLHRENIIRELLISAGNLRSMGIIR